MKNRLDLAKIIGAVAALSVIFLFIYIYYDSTVKAAPLDDSKATEEGVEEVVEGNNKFALELYKNLTEGGKNVFFSPWSISTALSMTYEGARGDTAKEMQSTFHLPKNDTTRRSSFARMYNLLNVNKKYELSLANALWAQKNYSFLENFINVNKNYYGAKVDNVNFKDPEKRKQARKMINNWVKKKTKGKIEKLIAKNKLNDVTRLVLTNAIYFKGDWVHQFDEDLTRKEDFKVAPGKSVKVSMMTYEGEPEFNYTVTENLKAIRLPYKGNGLAMYAILPREDFGLSKLGDSLTAGKLAKIEKDMNSQEVNVRLPKFEFKTKYNLEGKLREMGMKKAFSWPGANFSGMDGTTRLFIQFVTHKAYIKVNEEGTEAAAATAVGMGEKAVTTRFHADHPFIFLIQDDRTGSILFMGRIVNPNK